MSRVSFGDFVLDLDSRELLRGPQAVPLTPKAYQLLEILVTNRPKALSKFALQERLWPDTFVLEKNLVNLIAEIRQSLGDDPTASSLRAHSPPVRLRVSSTPGRNRIGQHNHATATAVRFRLLWANGRARLGEGEHVLGRDPDLELFFDSPGISRRHALIRVAGDDSDGRRSRQQERNVRRRSAVSTLQRSCVTATVSASVQSS